MEDSTVDDEELAEGGEVGDLGDAADVSGEDEEGRAATAVRRRVATQGVCREETRLRTARRSLRLEMP